MLTSRPTELEQRFAGSRDAVRRLNRLVPGGAHTYAKGADQYPDGLAPVLVSGSGAHVHDVDGNVFIEYGSGLRSVILGHGHPAVCAAVHAAVDRGTAFVRPTIHELEAAEALLAVLPRADMVKFTKNGSDATTAAVRLARAVTGRDLVAICRDQPFFSTDDWFIGSTGMPAGVPAGTASLTVTFPYGDLSAVGALFAEQQGRIACLVLEAATTTEPPPGYLHGLRQLCDAHGALLVLDEMITGIRWGVGGAQVAYDVDPDLSTFGKALGNGFAVSALAGRREHMERGGLTTSAERVFLLSTTHGAETTGLAAATAVLRTCSTEPVLETLVARGEQLRVGVEAAARDAGVEEHLVVLGRPSNMVYATLDADGQRSQAFRTLFLQELLRRGVLAPSFVVNAALSEQDVDHTVAAVHDACLVYRAALEDGVQHHLAGRPVKPVFRPYA